MQLNNITEEEMKTLLDDLLQLEIDAYNTKTAEKPFGFSAVFVM